MKDYNIAVYIRLSLADEDTGRSKAESDSIGNQRSLIGRFLDRHPTLSAYNRVEFCDDGFTGTNTDRPAFTDMMIRVKRGEFNMICVKDFSRFSRDYIEIGDCLECLFPFLGVRFISVNDSYDSDDYKGTTGGLDVVMRNIVYAAYSKDLSVKTTTAKLQMMKQGKFVGAYAPYGYILHPTIRNKLSVDPDAAQVVRRIFELAVGSLIPAQIAGRFNEEGIPTPGQYFRSKNPGTKKFRNMSTKINWTHTAVYNILVRQVYTGAAVGHTRSVVAMLSKQTKALPKEDWIIVEGMHEAIVSRELFEQAQTVIRKTTVADRTVQMYPLRSLVRCGNCGRAMVRDKNRFYCPYGKKDSHVGCNAVGVYPEKELETLVYGAISTMLQVVDTKQKPSAVTIGRKKTAMQECMELQSANQKQAEKLRRQKLKLYEQYTAGDISRETYIQSKSAIDGQLTKLEAEAAETQSRISELEHPAEPASTELEKVCHAYRQESELTYELAHAFVEAVYVHMDGRKEILWKFKDICDDTAGL